MADTAETRSEIRAKVFSGKNKPKTKEVTFFGTVIGIRQPTLGEALAIAEASSTPGVSKSAIVQALITYAYIPGTETRVFEDTDVPALEKLPWGADFLRVSRALEELSEVNFQEPSSS